MKPGAIFAGWLISAGLIRTFIEFFRPDQPHIGNLFVTYSMLVSFLMAIVGVIMLLVRYGKLHIAAADDWEEQYQIKPVEKNLRTRSEVTVAEGAAEDETEEAEIKPEKKKRTVKAKATVKKTSVKKASEEKKSPAKRTGSKSKSVK
jgi:hypothetical protein